MLCRTGGSRSNEMPTWISMVPNDGLYPKIKGTWAIMLGTLEVKVDRNGPRALRLHANNPRKRPELLETLSG